MFRHIIWDFDGTLFDTYPIMAGVFCSMLEQQGIVEPTEEILGYMKVSMSFALKHYGGKYNLDDAFLQDYKRQRREAENQICKPFEGIKRFANTFMDPADSTICIRIEGSRQSGF